MAHEYDAELRDAIPLPRRDGFVFAGTIYLDGRGRFVDGTEVTTSYIEEHVEPGIYRTRNTVYKVTFLREIDWSSNFLLPFVEKFGYVA